MRRALPFARDDGGLVSCGGAARARKRAGRTAAGGVATRTHGMVRSLLLCSRRTRSFLSMPSSRGSTLSRFFGAAASEDESARAESPDRFERTYNFVSGVTILPLVDDGGGSRLETRHAPAVVSAIGTGWCVKVYTN